MSNRYTAAAFNAICTEAKSHHQQWFVCLMESVATYGGPEEGGWWNHSTYVVESQRFDSEQAANEAAEKIKEMAEQLSIAQSRREGEECLRSLDWLEARGLDPDFLPEPSRTDYFVGVYDHLPQDCDRSSMRWADYEA